MEEPVFHLDLDAFFASVIIRDRPDLENVPVIVGPDPKEGHWRGVTVTSNYAARKYGIKSGMAISKAYALCPDALFLHPSFKDISKLSKEVMDLVKGYAGTFQQTGLDEAYFTSKQAFESWNHAKDLGSEIQQLIHERCRLPCSIGISYTRALAKIATELNKPRGLTIISPENREKLLRPLELRRISGVGKKTSSIIEGRGYKTFQDVLTKSLSHVEHDLGEIGRYIWHVAFGKTAREISEWAGRKSIGKERTFGKDYGNPKTIEKKLVSIGEKLQAELMEKGLQYQTVTLKIRFAPFKTYSKAHTFPAPLHDPVVGFQKAVELFRSFCPLQRKVRLIGVRYSHLSWGQGNQQTNLAQWFGPA